MKKALTIIIATSILSLGSLETRYCYSDEQKDSNAYTECLRKYENLVPGEDYAKGKIYVEFDEGTPGKDIEQFLKNEGLEILSYIQYMTAMVKVPEGKEVEYACDLVKRAGETMVNYAEPHLFIRIQN